MGGSGLEDVDLLRVALQSHNMVTALGHDHGESKADISHADDANSLVTPVDHAAPVISLRYDSYVRARPSANSTWGANPSSERSHPESSARRLAPVGLDGSQRNSPP